MSQLLYDVVCEEYTSICEIVWIVQGLIDGFTDCDSVVGKVGKVLLYLLQKF